MFIKVNILIAYLWISFSVCHTQLRQRSTMYTFTHITASHSRQKWHRLLAVFKTHSWDFRQVWAHILESNKSLLNQVIRKMPLSMIQSSIYTSITVRPSSQIHSAYQSRWAFILFDTIMKGSAAGVACYRSVEQEVHSLMHWGLSRKQMFTATSSYSCAGDRMTEGQRERETEKEK